VFTKIEAVEWKNEKNDGGMNGKEWRR